VESAVHEKLLRLTFLGYAGTLFEFAARPALKHGEGQGSSVCKTLCIFEFTIPVVNGLPGWKILRKTYAKIALNSCNWPTMRVIQHTESLFLLSGRHIYSYRLLAAIWWIIFYDELCETKLSEAFFHCCLHHLTALTFTVHTDFLKVFTSFVKILYFLSPHVFAMQQMQWKYELLTDLSYTLKLCKYNLRSI
jgi:hypothetical protein